MTEQKIILAAITQVRRDEPLTDDKLYSVTANALADMAGFKANHEYEMLKEASEKLWEQTLTVREKPTIDGSASTKTRKIRWVQEAVYVSDQGLVQLRFSKPILPYLTELKSQFTEYKFQFVANMKSRYGIRLYELLIQWRRIGERELEIDWLRQSWGIEGKYASIKDFKKYVLEPAVADVNNHSDLYVEWGQRKTGRKVTHLQFQFGPKEATSKPKRLTKAQIEKAARPGETWEQAKERLRRESPAEKDAGEVAL